MEKCSALVAGIELQLHRLSMVVLNPNRNLSVVGTQHVFFDTDLLEFKTEGGIILRPSFVANEGPRKLLPAAMIVRAFDLLMDRCFRSRDFDLASVGSIGICGPQHVPILLSHSAQDVLAHLSPQMPLAHQLSSDFFSSPFSPTGRDFTGTRSLRQLQDQFLSSLGMPIRAGPLSQQEVSIINKAAIDETGSGLKTGTFTCHLRHLWTELCWQLKPSSIHSQDLVVQRTEVILTAGAFIEALLIGRIPQIGVMEAAATGLCKIPSLFQDGAIEESGRPSWSKTMLDNVSNGHRKLLEAKLGSIDADPLATSQVSTWLVSRYGFNRRCVVTHAIPAAIASYYSFLPGVNDVGVGMTAAQDELVATLGSPLDCVAENEAQVVPNLFGEKQWLGITAFPGAADARRRVRDEHCNGRWTVMGQLVNAVPIGGSVGLDAKAVAISTCSGGLNRFQHGWYTRQFIDSRIEARAILEGQALAIRSSLGRQFSVTATRATGFHLGSNYGAGGWIGFDVTDESTAPRRVYGWGRAAGDAQMGEILSSVLGADLVVDPEDVAGSREEDATDLNIVMEPMIPGRQHGPRIRRTIGKGPLQVMQSHHDGRTRRATIGAGWVALCASFGDTRMDRVVRRMMGLAQGTDSKFPGFHPRWTAQLVDVQFSKQELASLWRHQRERVAREAAAAHGREAKDIKSRGLIQVADSDKDLFTIYGAFVAEYLRLESLTKSQQF